jgi:hypothetical protein
MFVPILVSLLVALCCGPVVAAEKSLSPALGAEKKRQAANEEAARLVGQWQIYMTKERARTIVTRTKAALLFQWVLIPSFYSWNTALTARFGECRV